MIKSLLGLVIFTSGISFANKTVIYTNGVKVMVDVKKSTKKRTNIKSLYKKNGKKIRYITKYVTDCPRKVKRVKRQSGDEGDITSILNKSQSEGVRNFATVAPQVIKQPSTNQQHYEDEDE
jgi:hypothetical protein